MRQTLEKHFEEVQLARLGLKPNGKHTPLGKMILADEDVAVRRRGEQFWPYCAPNPRIRRFYVAINKHSWKDEHREDLWEDLATIEANHHYMGAIVLESGELLVERVTDVHLFATNGEYYQFHANTRYK